MTAEPAEPTAPGTPPPGFRIRWGWFLGCIAAGSTAIATGWLIAAPAGRTDFLAGVLANVGTTLLLVGVVLLLERRIVDHAVEQFREVAGESRAQMRKDFRAEVNDFAKRMNAEWTAVSPEDVEAMKERTKKLSEELAANYVDKVTRADNLDGMPER